MFGRIDQRTVALTTRVNYTMTPTLSLQIYAEPFVSAGAYTNYKELVDGRAAEYGGRYAPYAYAGNADFNYPLVPDHQRAALGVSPGSTLFVVWQQGARTTSSIGDFRFGRDFSGCLRRPAHNVFLVKFSYWLNM